MSGPEAALPDLLTLGSRWTFVGGKGGVGKTTIAAALGISLADRGRNVLILSTDPAHSLGDALCVPLGGEPTPVRAVPRLEALEIDPSLEQARFLASRRDPLQELIRRGSLLDEEDLSAFGDLIVPGADELAALLRLLQFGDRADPYVVVDTAPTGHTLRLLDLPAVARGWIEALRTVEERERAVSLAFSGRYTLDRGAELLNEIDADLQRFSNLLRDPECTRFALVTNPEPVVLAETRRYAEALTTRGLGLAGIIVNRATEPVGDAGTGPGVVFVPRFAVDPRCPDPLRTVAASASAVPPREGGRPAPGAGSPRLGAAASAPDDRELYLVSGKGGVGKTTIASALAIDLARRREGRLLLLSIDPAGSLGDVLAMDVGSAPAAVPGVPQLEVQQLVAEELWGALRAELAGEVERLLGGMAGGTARAGMDPELVGRWLELAPPGIDELLALLQVIDLTADRSYRAVVLDTAPTGHLLRLLELPAQALGWVRTLLRILLKYRAVVGLGQLAERLLHLSRDLRSLDERLHDPATTWFAAVSLPEALSVPETRRLLGRVRALGIAPDVVILNRILQPDGQLVPGGIGAAREMTALAEDLPVIVTPSLPGGPVGPDDLGAFARTWRSLEKS